MAASVREFFETLPARLDASKTAGMSNTYVFDIAGAGAWTVDVDDGAVAVRQGASEADCTISAAEADFLKLVRGEQNPFAAYMSGKIKVSGDTGAAMKLQKLF